MEWNELTQEQQDAVRRLSVAVQMGIDDIMIGLSVIERAASMPESWRTMGAVYMSVPVLGVEGKRPPMGKTFLPTSATYQYQPPPMTPARRDPFAFRVSTEQRMMLAGVDPVNGPHPLPRHLTDPLGKYEINETTGEPVGDDGPVVLPE